MATSVERAPGVPKAIPLDNISFRAQWAARSIREGQGRVQQEAGVIPTQSADKYHLLPISNTRTTSGPTTNVSGFEVSIIGAGAAGLFTAMIFDHLNEKFPGLNVKYTILEAEEKRFGGRLFTYKFPQKSNQPKIGPHDYYDVGAMRFPEVTTMERTFALFDTLKMERVKDPKQQKPQPGDLIPYFFSGPNQPALYNGVQVVQKDKKPKMSAKTFQVPDLPVRVQDIAASDLIDDQIQNLKYKYENEGAKEFWRALRKTVDPYTVRQYFTTQIPEPLDYKTLEFCETLNFGNRWYDQAASEMVLESLDFNATAPWWCVEGGAAEISNRMMAQIEHQDAVNFGKVVTAISYKKDDQGSMKVDVAIDGKSSLTLYDAVFNSAPLGAMQHMHLEGLNLNWGVKSAIRSLGYGASCKVGIRFKSLWWMTELGITQGGQGKTDLPIRCCVYPSYNVNDPQDGPGVLLVSYTWSQEAERIGALIDKNSPANEDELRKLLFHDLARLHSKTGDDQQYQHLYDLIESSYLDHYAYDWYKNPRTVGAFAYFGPGQFSNWYCDLTQSDGKYVIIGEAASAHHAWVVGALESAVRGVYQFLWKNSGKSEAAAAATSAYNDDKIAAPFGPIPAEYDRSEDIQLPSDANLDTTKTLSSPIGELARMQVLLESIRLKQGGDTINPSKITEEQIKPILDALVGA
ncbi:hypothetical protein CC86DRAFT_342661 [Ophiobolus disseminans]|uniref:Amine oxidase domain-containing protein n=1 Tax=Ophiobolus disseminans TaxID=1469910 RepID=A0A6A7AFK9_9PLEO|nr:hypothetical protein CC86DRAFT_342661 [Ophiobolus disseminans]